MSSSFKTGVCAMTMLRTYLVLVPGTLYSVSIRILHTGIPNEKRNIQEVTSQRTDVLTVLWYFSLLRITRIYSIMELLYVEYPLASTVTGNYHSSIS